MVYLHHADHFLQVDSSGDILVTHLEGHARVVGNFAISRDHADLEPLYQPSLYNPRTEHSHTIRFSRKGGRDDRSNFALPEQVRPNFT